MVGLMNETNFFIKYSPYYVPILAAILLIIFTKNYLFRGMVSDDQYKDMLMRERELVKAQETTSSNLQEIASLLSSLTKKVSEEIGQNTDRLQRLELAMSEFLDQLRDLNYNFEMHRKGVPATEVFLRERKKQGAQKT
jgi:vacuolar-type H+-ATPase subunit I/STV1